jgi:hypothetical protein
MAFTRSADGIAKKGKTDGKNYGNSGPTVAATHGNKGTKGGKTNEDMLKLGRGLAKVANQMRG